MGVTNTISGHPPKPHTGSCGLEAGGVLKDRLDFHYVVVKSTHILKSKTFVKLFFLVSVSGLKIIPVAGMNREAAEARH